MKRGWFVILALLAVAGCNANNTVSPALPSGPPGPPPQSIAIVEFPTSATLLGGLAIASDNNVYFSTTTELGIFTPSTGRYTLAVHRDTWPVIPTLKPSGAVSSSSGTVSALATSGTSPTVTRPRAGSTPSVPALVRFTILSNSFTEAYGAAGDVFEDVTMTPDGNSWVTANEPTTFGLTGLLLTTRGGCAPLHLPDAIGSITVGADGFLWLASDPQLNESTTSKIFRVDPSTNQVVNTYSLGAGSFVSGLTAGPDNALWFTDAGLNEIGRLGTDGSVTYYPVLSPSSGLVSITTGCDGALWFTEKQSNKIGRITTTGTVTEYPVPTANAGLGDIEGCLDGRVFFTETHAIGEVTSPV